MKKGYIIDENNTPRNLLSNATQVVHGGEDNDGVSRLGDTLMFDGRTVADGSYGKKVGVFKDSSNRLRYNGDFVKDYPSGVTDIFQVYYKSSYTYQDSSTGPKQGAAIYHNVFYQFYERGHCETYDILKGINSRFDIPISVFGDIQGQDHMSSAQFSDEFENESDSLPLIYFSTGQATTVVNLNPPIHFVRRYSFDYANGVTQNNPPHPSFGIYDFQHSRGWWFGYPQGVANDTQAHRTAGKFEVVPFTFIKGRNSITPDYDNRHSILKEEANYLNESPYPNSDSDWCNIQGGFYKDGKCYVLFGGINGQNNRCKILIYDVESKNYSIIYTGIGRSTSAGAEGEGIVPFKNGFIISSLHQGEKLFVPEPDLI